MNVDLLYHAQKHTLRQYDERGETHLICDFRLRRALVLILLSGVGNESEEENESIIFELK